MSVAFLHKELVLPLFSASTSNNSSMLLLQHQPQIASHKTSSTATTTTISSRAAASPTQAGLKQEPCLLPSRNRPSNSARRRMAPMLQLHPAQSLSPQTSPVESLPKHPKQLSPFHTFSTCPCLAKSLAPTPLKDFDHPCSAPAPLLTIPACPTAH